MYKIILHSDKHENDNVFCDWLVVGHVRITSCVQISGIRETTGNTKLLLIMAVSNELKQQILYILNTTSHPETEFKKLIKH